MLEHLAKYIERVEGAAVDLADDNVRFKKLQEYAHIVTLFFEFELKRCFPSEPSKFAFESGVLLLEVQSHVACTSPPEQEPDEPDGT